MAMTHEATGVDYLLGEAGDTHGETKNYPATATAGDLLMVFIASTQRTHPAITGYTKLGSKTSGNGLIYDVFYKIAAGGETNVVIDYGVNTIYFGHVRQYHNPTATNVYEIASTLTTALHEVTLTQTGNAGGAGQPYITCIAWLGTDGTTGSITSGGGGNFGTESPGTFGGQPVGGEAEADDLDAGHLAADRYVCTFGYANVTLPVGDVVGYFLGVGTAPAPPLNTVAPAVTGTAKVGKTLTCSSGTWTGDAPITYAYQWKLGSGTNIGGATASTFKLTNAQKGLTVKCTVTATNANSAVAATSSATAAVKANKLPTYVLRNGDS